MTQNLGPLMRYILDFDQLQDYVSKNEGLLPNLIRDYFLKLGNDLGFESEKNFSAKFNKIEMGSVKLAWVDSNKIAAAFEIEFGNKAEFLSSLWKLMALDTQNAVLITSSKARNFSPDETKKLVSMFSKKPENFLVLIDIAKEEFFLL